MYKEVGMLVFPFSLPDSPVLREKVTKTMRGISLANSEFVRVFEVLEV
nr:hypothetical protein Iba_chr08bCG13210 [Ipomoea batatas]